MPSRVALALTLVALALPAAAAGATVKVPDGDYSGTPHKVFMRVGGKSIEILAFSFRCKSTHGRTSVNAIALKRTDNGYRFATDTHGLVSYKDGHADQNGAISVNGQFGRGARSVKGKFQVITRRCGTGHLDWDAQRVDGAR